jgi:hypothetical protein
MVETLQNSRMIYQSCKVVLVFDSQTRRIRLRPLEEHLPSLWIKCSRKLREKYPIGSILTMDLKLVHSEKRKPYLLSISESFGQLSLF